MNAPGPASDQSQRIPGPAVDDHVGVGEEQLVQLGPRPTVDHVGVGVLEPPHPGVVDGLGHQRFVDHRASAAAVTWGSSARTGWRRRCG